MRDIRMRDVSRATGYAVADLVVVLDAVAAHEGRDGWQYLDKAGLVWCWESGIEPHTVARWYLNWPGNVRAEVSVVALARLMDRICPTHRFYDGMPHMEADERDGDPIIVNGSGIVLLQKDGR